MDVVGCEVLQQGFSGSGRLLATLHAGTPRGWGPITMLSEAGQAVARYAAACPLLLLLLPPADVAGRCHLLSSGGQHAARRTDSAR